jgi:dTDP-4-amino-4,6-dideoxygalactose transaminase
MEVLPERIAKRRNAFDRYQQKLDNIPGISFLQEPPGFISNRWLTTAIIDPKLTGGITREDLRLAFESENIESRPLWKPMHLQPIFKGYPYYGEKVCETLFELGLCLPSGSNLTNNDFDRIFEVFDSVLKAKTIQ